MSVEKVNPKDRFKVFANEWNSISDAVRWVDLQRFPSGNLEKGEPKNTGIIEVQNGTGAAQSALSIFALDDDLSITPEAGEETEQFKADEPIFKFELFSSLAGSDLYTRKIVVALQAAEIDEIITGMVFGITPLLINIIDENHTHASQIAGSLETLDSGFLGPCEILWKPSGTGEKVCAVWIKNNKWGPSAPSNPYVIDRRTDADDALEWNPFSEKPADWKDYDGVTVKQRVLRYTSGAGAKLEYIDTDTTWSAMNAPIISAATVTLATTGTC